MTQNPTNPQAAKIKSQVAQDLSTYFTEGARSIIAGVALIGHAKKGYLAAAPVLAAPEVERIAKLLAELAGGWTDGPFFDQRLFFDILRLAIDGALTVNEAAFAEVAPAAAA